MEHMNNKNPEDESGTDMLYRIKNAKKFDRETPVQWFANNYFDLTVWLDAGGKRITGFQLTYDKYDNPHAITWKENGEFTHDKIDDGERTGKFKQSPILVADGEFPGDRIAERFKAESAEIDPEIKKFVLERLSVYRENID